MIDAAFFLASGFCYLCALVLLHVLPVHLDRSWYIMHCEILTFLVNLDASSCQCSRKSRC